MVNQFVRQLAVFCLALSFQTGVIAQTQPPKKKPAAAKKSSPTKTSTAQKKTSLPAKKTNTSVAAISKPKPKPIATPVDPAVEKERFDKAIATETPAEKAMELARFVAEFPDSEYRTRAQESLAGVRAVLGDERLAAGETADGVKLLRMAVEDAPKPYSDKLFTEVIVNVPANLFWRGERTAAFEIASIIEKNAAANAKQLAGLANFYLGIENGTDAKRLAEAAVRLDDANAAAHQALALSHRLNFDLEESAKSYARAVELDPASDAAKRGLAEMKRALGKPDEAIAIYTELLAKNDADPQARTGLILSMFEAGKRAEAEAEMNKSLERTPGNVVLLTGAAYWYASQGNADRAVELARKAVEKEPRYIWSHIALGRGLMLQKKPVDAEQALVAARRYGNFPTLEYEIASARMAAGFFREAAEELRKSFAVRDGNVSTKLGGRIDRSEASFVDLISHERKASIFAATSADSSENAGRLKALLDLNQKLANDSPSETEVVALADQFVAGDDKMRAHRELYAANALLAKKIAPVKAFELTRSAVANADASLDVSNANAAVMATELYESRALAFSRDDFLLVPDVPRQTLSSILRGRIEETAGLALMQQGIAADATVRFRRAISVYPKDSAWWRSATWHLGAALQAEGKESDALVQYITSYRIDKPDLARYLVVEALYKKVNGSDEGLEAKIGPNPLPSFAAEEPSKSGESATPPEPEKSSGAEAQATPVANIEPAKTETKQETAVEAIPQVTTPRPASESNENKESKTEPPPVIEPKKEESKTEQPVNSESKTEEPPKTEAKPEEKKAEPAAEQSENKPPEIAAVVEATPEPPKENLSPPETKPAPKSLFEPVVITIPGRTPAKTVAKEPAPTEKEQTPETGEKPNEDATESPDGIGRPRVVAGKEIKAEIPPCTIGVSQENISLINGGGSVGILVSLEGEGDPKSIRATTKSPEDVQVRPEPEIAGIKGRAFFVIKSISANLGVYQVKFEAPCGKKEITVNVR